MLRALRVWLAKRELDLAFNAMRSDASLANVHRFAKASNNYYRTKYPDSLYV